MPTVQVETQLNTDELLGAVQQLSKSELDKFVSQVVNLRAKLQTPSLPKKEAVLLQKINQGIPLNLNDKYKKLIIKRQAENLTQEEYKELLLLSNKVEKIEAQRVDNLAKLANLRQVSITDLMNSLGIQAPTYV